MKYSMLNLPQTYDRNAPRQIEEGQGMVVASIYVRCPTPEGTHIRMYSVGEKKGDTVVFSEWILEQPKSCTGFISTRAAQEDSHE